MDKLRLVSVILFAFVFMVPEGPVTARGPQAAPAATSAYVPAAGKWSGKTKLGYPVSFTVNSLGTSWSNFQMYTKATFSGCSAIIFRSVLVSGPITSGQFSWTGATFRFAGQFTSATTAAGTYAFTNYKVEGCANKLFSQSGTWTAKAPSGPPAAFAKASPADGATDAAVSPSLSWNASAGAGRYAYCLDTASHTAGDTTCGTAWLSTGTARSVTVAPALAENATYYWQVRATNASGTTYADAGVWWSFTTGTLPTVFGKSSPTNAATNQALASTLSWAASSGAVSYQYCFDTVNNNACDATWTSTGTATTVDPSGVFLPGKTYYWQVRAVNPVGPRYADGNAWWAFSTVPPSVLTLRSAGTLDGWVLESAENSGVGGKVNATGTVFLLGDDAGNRQYRSILWFGTSAVPSKAVIVGVTLRIKKAGGSPVNPFSTLGGIAVDVKKGPFGSGSLQLSDFQATASRLGVMSIGATPAPVNGWYSRSLAAQFFTYINRIGPTQFRLRFAKDDNNNHVANYLSFYSGNVATAYRPQLVIQYYVP